MTPDRTQTTPAPPRPTEPPPTPPPALQADRIDPPTPPFGVPRWVPEEGDFS